MVSLVMRPTRGDDAAKPKAQVRQAPRPKRKAKARSRLSGRWRCRSTRRTWTALLTGQLLEISPWTSRQEWLLSLWPWRWTKRVVPSGRSWERKEYHSYDKLQAHLRTSGIEANMGIHILKLELLYNQWEIQDPKIEVLYHIRPYFVGIFPYIGLI